MKILEILPMAGWAGTAQYMENLIGGVQERGHVVHLLTRDLPVTQRFDSLCTVHHWPLKKDALSYRHIFKLYRLIRENQYDVVHVHGGKDAWVAILSRFLGRGNYVVCSTRHDLNRKIHKDWLHKWFYRQLDSSICVSRTVQNDFLRKNPFVDEKKAPLVYNGIDVSRFSFCSETRELVREDLNLGNEELAIGIFSRICYQKGIHLAVEAFSMLCEKVGKKVHLYIYGDVVEKAYFEDIVNEIRNKRLHECVHFMGFATDAAVKMMGMDVILVPNVEKESFGLTVCEAMSLERIVIVTDLGGPAEIVKREYGVISKAESESIAEALKKIIDMEVSERNTMGKQACRIVSEKFSYKRMAEEMESVFYDLIEQRR